MPAFRCEPDVVSGKMVGGLMAVTCAVQRLMKMAGEVSDLEAISRCHFLY